ncbi:bifunctional diaminohydroxyphosphoribosylaminopyrimidine deaminase/5-amino-6-(5-phosphoribosylamino)uracil reductase RibD [Christiangramia salexigens]|uniref:Riboflavin biosynthesis protein RibD n=1 Tax=Christiangramia salexigens TaxID=1913577 RepID=A0A1L3J1H3_9FLAO|nr:bifunctional diaminohydroxyphosphoribosylaminopyrimidine deaminase/5-amino-6-(5-phosphoribosylamino)uracil reductase RibD [Christiangramia salexigens]APG58974.1 riboflavin biosynthesis protein RibD [Christiangramia salexigens]
MNIHEIYIKRCIELAGNGLGRTYPNPMVGSLIVHNDRIIGEGWHRKAGEPHAEVNAINSVAAEDEKLLSSSTIYVSLEPCSHYGKTPPCSDLIIDKGIKKVVIGTIDPFAKVAGRGIKKLMDAGCEVNVGVLDKECQNLNKRFFCFHKNKRPYIILKWAQSNDRFIAPVHKTKNRPVWITNKYAGQLVHKWRSEEASILVGTTTALVDDPKLNLRKWHGEAPTRLVIDKNHKIPNENALKDRSQKTIVLCEIEKEDKENLIYEEIDFSKEICIQICGILYKHEIQSVIIEGGRKTLQQFIDSGLWDEARVFTGNIQIRDGVKAPELKGILIKEENIQDNNLKIYKNDRGDNI